jgi:hypothetical protein
MRLRSWLRRRDRQGRRVQVLATAAVLGGVLAWLIVGGVGLWLQPRFTVLELAAQRLAPDVGAAQPPVEQVATNGAFDRAYTVRFPTPAGGMDAVLDHATTQRWRVVDRSPRGRTVLHREGVVATVRVGPAVTTVRTRVSAGVRDRQRTSRRLAAAVGAALASGWVWRQVRGRPRAV